MYTPSEVQIPTEKNTTIFRRMRIFLVNSIFKTLTYNYLCVCYIMSITITSMALNFYIKN